jgi:hypothetical protein
MKRFYTVDRDKSLREGLILELVRYDDITPMKLQIHVNEMFPVGVSSHGDRYFLKNNSLANLASSNIEVLFEYVRRAGYPTRPSRFQSMFAFEIEAQAISFREQYGQPNNPLWEVEAEEFFSADMHFLTTGNSILTYSYFAHKYWKGEPSQYPSWEILLIPPVHVLRKLV